MGSFSERFKSGLLGIRGLFCDGARCWYAAVGAECVVLSVCRCKCAHLWSAALSCCGAETQSIAASCGCVQQGVGLGPLTMFVESCSSQLL